MSRLKAGRRALGLLAIALLASSVGLTVRSRELGEWLEHATVDARFSLRGAERVSSGVAVVGIDNDSLGRLPRFPFSRRLHARVIENLHRAGARLIVYDVAFDRPTSVAADDALFEAARRGAPVVFATSLISPSGETEVLGGNANLAEIGDAAGAGDLVPDSDGVLRHTLAAYSHLPSIAAAVLRALHGRHVDTRLMRNGWIDFPGPPHTIPNLSFASVWRGRFDPAAVRGKVVVVGATAPSLQDQHATAVGSPMPGPEVQAAAIATALANFPLRSPRGYTSVLLIVLLAFAIPLCGLRLGTLGVALAALGALILWSLAAQVAFDGGTALDYTDPLVALLVATGGTLALGLWADSRERRRLRELFAADATAVVEQVLAGGGHGALQPTAIIAGYRIERAIGRGGMGVVYHATQQALGRAVAVKLIAPESARDELFRERFKAESRMAAAIEHVNVIPVYEAGEDDGLLFIAMRLVDGVDLARHLRDGVALQPARALALVAQLAAALDAAHAQGLIHRDVKPANALVTLDEPEHLYLTDFGVAKQIRGVADQTVGDGWVGTLDYLSPEQIQGEPVDARTDVYALTGVLYHCITGEVPFPRESEPAKLWAHMNAPPPAPSRRNPALSSAVDEVIACGMAKVRTARFASAGEVARAYAQALGLVTGSHRTQSQPQRAEAPPNRSEEPFVRTAISSQTRPAEEADAPQTS
jgi:serine/threonine protein kinase